MSFTEDELQSFNKILEQRLIAHRHDMEQAFDQRINGLRREMEQHLSTVQREILHTLTQKLSEHHNQLNVGLEQMMNTQQTRLAQTVSQDGEQKNQQQQQHFEGLIEGTLAAQLIAIEQLLNQRFMLRSAAEAATQASQPPPQFETFEVQTEIPWEDLLEVFGQALDARFNLLNESIQSAIKSWEQYLSRHLHTLQGLLRDELAHKQASNGSAASLDATYIQEVVQGIQQLEHIIESMQVAMTNNHALLSNRLYHHQSLPLERAHPANQATASFPNGGKGPLTHTKEREGSGDSLPHR